MCDKNGSSPFKTFKQRERDVLSSKHSSGGPSRFRNNNKNHSVSFDLQQRILPVSTPIHEPQCASTPVPLKSTTQPLHQLVLNPQASNPKLLPTIQQTQQRIDHLLKQKLKLLVQLNKRRLFNKHKQQTDSNQIIKQIDGTNQQISSLIRRIRRSSSQQSGELERKINIVEKIMAENESEGEVIKRHYSQLCQNSTTYKSFYHSSSPSTVHRADTYFSLQKEKKIHQDSVLQLPCSSTNKISYKPPSSSDYEKYRYRQSKPEENSEVIVRLSSYKSSFPHFTPPKLPSETTLRKQFSVMDSSINRKSISSYQHEFQPYKEWEPSDYKNMDCYQNKFKHIKINWDSKKQHSSLKELNDYVVLQKSPSPDPDKQTQYSKCTNLVPEAKSVYNTNFEGSNEERRVEMIKPKNKKLNALRVSFREFCNKI